MRSFLYAVRGIGKTLRTERNFRIMFICFLLSIAAGFFFRISSVEWAVVLLCCGIVLALEMVNTAIESLTNLITEEHHPLAEKAKDIAAGAVLVFCAAAFIIALIIFLPYVINLISR